MKRPDRFLVFFVVVVKYYLVKLIQTEVNDDNKRTTYCSFEDQVFSNNTDVMSTGRSEN